MTKPISGTLIVMAMSGSTALAFQVPLQPPQLQPPPQLPRQGPPPPVIRVGTRLVQVEVVVRDKDGAVTGLKKEDFTLLDQGEKQEIMVFNPNAPTSEASRDAAAKALPAGAVSNRTDSSGHPIPGVTVLLLDQLNTFFEKQGYARSELLKYLQSAPPSDRIAIYLLGKELRLIQDFTDNSGAVSEAVKKWSPDNLFVMLANAEDMGATDNAVNDDPVYAEIRQRITTDAITKIAEQLSRMPGRKNLVWISDRPGSAGVQFLAGANIHLYPVLARAVGPSGVAAWLRDSRAAGRAGAPPPPPGSGDELDREKANAALASANGGVAFTDSRDISLAIKTATEDAEDAYVLGFYPKEEKLDNKFHALAVTAGKARGKALEIRYRPGYLASRPQPSAPQTAVPPANAPGAASTRPVPARSEPTKLTLDELLKDPLDLSQVDVTVEPSPDQARPGSVLVKVKIDPRDLALQHEDSKRSGLVDVSFSVRESGKLVTRTLKVDIPDDEYDAFLENGIETVESIDTAGAKGTLRVVVQDQATGAAGSVTVPIGR
jgi:VWFA-related protein